ncbi:MAG TPA: NYN domain-containing protein, partial [Gemmatimonadaceae bacterium]
MNPRQSRRAPTRSSHSALVHRGPGAHAAVASHGPSPIHSAPNAALLIDFDNVTMGIRSDLGKELRNLLGSDIIKGKVAVQRAYADWRRYPQYIVPLSESSIDLIFAPAYGSSKKNATDIRLAIDALELVFTRQEIGTFILLSGDSDFSSLVIKLKEYGKYVIGVGIRESSSDLLVQNCDEYYSYNALAGLVKSSDDEPRQKHDPWELVKEAITRMKQNHDVMRSDRLKQVMQEIDPTFDESNVGIAKFSKFCQEAAAKGLLSVRRLENGQLDVDVAGAFTSDIPVGAPSEMARPEAPAGGGGRRRRGGRGRGRGGRGRGEHTGEHPVPAVAAAAPPRAPVDEVGLSGERLTRDEAFDLVRRAVARLVTGEQTIGIAEVRRAARLVLGRDSESLSDRNFSRIVKDAHDNGVVRLDSASMELGRVTESSQDGELFHVAGLDFDHFLIPPDRYRHIPTGFAQGGG